MSCGIGGRWAWCKTGKDFFLAGGAPRSAKPQENTDRRNINRHCGCLSVKWGKFRETLNHTKQPHTSYTLIHTLYILLCCVFVRARVYVLCCTDINAHTHTHTHTHLFHTHRHTHRVVKCIKYYYCSCAKYGNWVKYHHYSNKTVWWQAFPTLRASCLSF